MPVYWGLWQSFKFLVLLVALIGLLFPLRSSNHRYSLPGQEYQIIKSSHLRQHILPRLIMPTYSITSKEEIRAFLATTGPWPCDLWPDCWILCRINGWNGYSRQWGQSWPSASWPNGPSFSGRTIEDDELFQYRQRSLSYCTLTVPLPH